jgi:hypothetical protein
MMDISSLSFRRNAVYTALSLAIGACPVSSARAQDPVPKDRSLDVQWPSTELNRASALQQKVRSRNASPDSLQADALSSIRIPVLVPEKAVEMQNFAVRHAYGDGLPARARSLRHPLHDHDRMQQKRGRPLRDR